jgi:hypothetical protein
VDAIVKWFHEGGQVIASADTATIDQLGRLRKESLLWRAIKLNMPQKNKAVFGGPILAADTTGFAKLALNGVKEFLFSVSPESSAEVVPYVKDNSLLLHIVRHETTSHVLRVRLPPDVGSASRACELFIPGKNQQTPLTSSADDYGTFLELTEPRVYCVVRISLTR